MSYLVPGTFLLRESPRREDGEEGERASERGKRERERERERNAPERVVEMRDMRARSCMGMDGAWE